MKTFSKEFYKLADSVREPNFSALAWGESPTYQKNNTLKLILELAKWQEEHPPLPDHINSIIWNIEELFMYGKSSQIKLSNKIEDVLFAMNVLCERGKFELSDCAINCPKSHIVLSGLQECLMVATEFSFSCEKCNTWHPLKLDHFNFLFEITKEYKEALIEFKNKQQGIKC